MGNSKQTMQLQERIFAFTKLGEILNHWGQNPENHPDVFQVAKNHNGWFTEYSIATSFKNWSRVLQKETMEQWIKPYNFSNSIQQKTIAIIMAGNIPLVGFHDFITVIMAGHKVIAKLSSNDKILLPLLVKELIAIDLRFKNLITIIDQKLPAFDAVIATGSNNTALYFDHYFGKYPNIIRKNRNSVAVLSGNETPAQLEALTKDIMLYFGLGCRNVSKIYIPREYDLNKIFNALYAWKEQIYNDKYMNNYDYNKAVYLMDSVTLLDNEFILLKEDQGLSSPIAVLFYEYYDDKQSLESLLMKHKDGIQCIVSNTGISNEVDFGKAQSPLLWEYADGVDTMQFVLNL